MPTTLRDLPFESQLESLEKFWDDEMARVGEQDAAGWATWSESTQSSAFQSSSHVATQSSKDSRNVSDPYIDWSGQEAIADRMMNMPTRSGQEVEDSDLFGTILFDDIRSLLFPVRSAPGRHALRRAWLSLLGLHIPGFAESLSTDRHADTNDRWCCTYLTSPHNLSSLFPSEAKERRITTDAFAGVVIGREREYESGFGPVQNWGYGVMGPLEGVDGRSCLWNRRAVQDLDESLLRRIFAQLRQGEDDPEWDVLCLAFEAASSVKS
jgi:hypothetical protein